MLVAVASSSLHAPARIELNRPQSFLKLGYGVPLTERKKQKHPLQLGKKSQLFCYPFYLSPRPSSPFQRFTPPPFGLYHFPSSLTISRLARRTFLNFLKPGYVEATDTMGGCFGHGKRKNKTDLVINDLSPKRETKDEVKDEIWFDSRLVFESDSDDDFKSVNGDSLPSSFGYSYSNQGTPRPTFASLKERMENLVQQNGADGTHLAPQSKPTSPEAKKTLGELFTHTPEADKKPESDHVPRQASGHVHDNVSQKSCLPGLLSSVGINLKKSPSSPGPNRTKTTQVRLPFRLCSS